MENKKGFTLIEFIIVMAIIGILILLAAPKFMDYIRNAKLTQIKNDTRVVEDILLTEQGELLTKDQNINKYLIEDVINDKGIAKDNKELANIDQGKGIQIDPELIKKYTNTKLNPEGFYFNKKENKVFYYNEKGQSITNKDDKAEDDEEPIISEEDKQLYELAKHIYIISEDGNNITVKGAKSPYTLSELLKKPEYAPFKGQNNDDLNIQTLKYLEKTGKKIVKIEDNAFFINNIRGEFPELYYVKSIGNQAFERAQFTGDFPNLIDLEEIGDKAFSESSFTGEFPKLENLKLLGDYSLQNSTFTEEFPYLESLNSIGNYALEKSQFSGNFPNMNNLTNIGEFSLSRSRFYGEFPSLPKITNIDSGSFTSSKFSGKFPKLDTLENIGYASFTQSNFNKEFPNLIKVNNIGSNAFLDSTFEGKFPELKNIKEIGFRAFENSNFSNSFPELNLIEKIDYNAFYNSNFTGEFPKLDKLIEVGQGAFYNSQFTGTLNLANIKRIGLSRREVNNQEIGAYQNSLFTNIIIPNIEAIGDQTFYSSKMDINFPILNNLEVIGYNAFKNSNLTFSDNYYKGWDGYNLWLKK